MTYAKALKIIEKCCDKEMQKLAFDANCFERFPGIERGNPNAETAHKNREEIRQALAIVKGQRWMG